MPAVLSRVLIVTAALFTLVCSHRMGFAQGQSPETLTIADCRVSLLSRTNVAGERMGILEVVEVREGDLVQAGQVLARLRDQLAQAALATADREARNDIDLRYAKKASELATLEYSKALTLTREIPGGHSEIDLLKLKLAAERAVLQVEQAAQHLEMAALRRKECQIALEAYQIKAPFDGVVLQVQKRAGEAMHAGESVVLMANFGKMRIEGFLPAAAARRIHPGAPVWVEVDAGEADDPSGDFNFDGQITFIDPIINEISQQVRIWAEVDNKNELLKDGMKAIMHVQYIRTRPEQAVQPASNPTR